MNDDKTEAEKMMMGEGSSLFDDVVRGYRFRCYLDYRASLECLELDGIALDKKEAEAFIRDHRARVKKKTGEECLCMLVYIGYSASDIIDGIRTPLDKSNCPDDDDMGSRCCMIGEEAGSAGPAPANGGIQKAFLILVARLEEQGLEGRALAEEAKRHVPELLDRFPKQRHVEDSLMWNAERLARLGDFGKRVDDMMKSFRSKKRSVIKIKENKKARTRYEEALLLYQQIRELQPYRGIVEELEKEMAELELAARDRGL